MVVCAAKQLRMSEAAGCDVGEKGWLLQCSSSLCTQCYGVISTARCTVRDLSLGVI